AARCSVSPIAYAVSKAGRSPTQAAPRLPMVWWLSDLPSTPYENRKEMTDTSAAPGEAAAATTLPALENHGFSCGPLGRGVSERAIHPRDGTRASTVTLGQGVRAAKPRSGNRVTTETAVTRFP